MRRGLGAALAAAGALLAVHAPAAAAKVAPFGHPCTPQDGVLFCPTSSDAQRVKTFDGVPLDVDVTLPASGVGRPLPTIVMLHGFPGTKQSFESTTPAPPGVGLLYHYNNNFFAKRGYAVVNYSARGFGRSCGEADSRTHPGCDRGWFHLADQRFEMRDAQTLLGKLVDQGITDPNRIGVTGVSYGGGSSLQLAYLRDRIRELDGDLVPWRSPAGRRLSIAAAYPRWGWSDLLYSLVPNGRFHDFGVGDEDESLEPIGVAKKSLVDALYFGGVAVGYLAPRGADPTADVATWRDVLEAGKPYGRRVTAIARQVHTYKSAVTLPGRPAPLLIMDGFTDPAFSASEALRTYDQLRAWDDPPYVSLQLGDLGHFRAGNNFEMYRDFADDGTAFLAHYLKGTDAGGPRAGSVKVYGQGCPKGTLGPGPIESTSFRRVARGELRLHLDRERALRNGSDAVAKFFDPVPNSDPCSTVPLDAAPPRIAATSPGFTLAGLTGVRADVDNAGSYAQIDARLLDVFDRRERLIDYGTYRLLPGQSGRIDFQLAGNVYRFARGHVVRLELVKRNAPTFLPDAPARIAVDDVAVTIPTR